MNKILLLVAAIAVAFTTDLPVTGAQAQKLAGRTVKIGCLAPLTGKGAEWGQGAKPSMELAAEEINAKGGIGGLPIELICYDTPDQGIRSLAANEPASSIATRSWRSTAPASAARSR